MQEIRKLYLMHFLAGLSNAASVTFTLYFLSHGVTQAQIGQLFGMFMIYLAVFEIPTGGLADIFGHKLSVISGLLLQGTGFLLFFLYPYYTGFLWGMFLNALGLAFQSGATSSLIYELLHKEKLHEDFQKVIGKTSGYFTIGALVASPVGSFIYKFYPGIPYVLSFFFFLTAACVIYCIKWEFVKKPPTFSTYIKMMTSGIHLTLKNRVLLATVIIGIALTTNRMVFNQNINQPYQISIGIDVAYIGMVAALLAAAHAGISMNAYKISRKIGKTFSLLLIISIPSIAVIALSFINSLLAISLIVVLAMGHAFREPVLAHITQDEVTRDKRSTMASTISFLVSVIVGLSLPYWGKGIDIFGINTMLVFLGIFSFVIGMVGLLLLKKRL